MHLKYVKKFITLMLEIDGLSNKDALFHLKDGLNNWARLEFNRRNMQTLDDCGDVYGLQVQGKEDL
ncbi:9-cis-epoxycarotenoid dioxygenase NCED6 [Cucumis melo var. makuwa]|uniref:9-cis-epoxycarotenoid dioxygenase NCED6 n=1 Tax=Cucumis melo var. makuwa TaxID=1194695 RepID=A0A5D3BXA9_CUCMM|nr:9-cis-epoxycarotenoid dioxygenase NCED6 [Cucumis melo var. makuwa]